GCGQRIAQREPPSRRNLVRLLIERVHVQPLGSLTKQNGKSGSSLEAIHIAVAAETRHPHRRTGVHDQRSCPLQRSLVLERAEHRLLKLRLVLRSVTCSGDEAKRKNAVRLHLTQRGDDQLLVHFGLAHVAQVAEQCERAQLLLTKQALPGL